jgi:hypothetical protein
VAPEKSYGKRCGCGHTVSDDWLCVNGGLYGPCESEFCGGACVWVGTCRENESCLCGEDD